MLPALFLSFGFGFNPNLQTPLSPAPNVGIVCPDGTALLGGGTCPTPSAPGPLAIAGVVVTFAKARQIRNRIKK